MEQYNPQDQHPVKEKNVYLLHLDGPRILILSALIIGLVTIAVLIGMKVSDGGQSEQVLAQNDALMEPGKNLQSRDLTDPLKDPLPDLQSQQSLAVSPQPLDGQLTHNGASTQPTVPQKSMGTDLPVSDPTHEVIQPSKTDPSKLDVKPTHPAKKGTAKKKHKAGKKSGDDVVEVSDGKIKSEGSSAHGFVLQVASYDKADSAKKEVKKLKDLSFDAYFDKKQVKGKDFYRVRIGPLASKDKALQMLDEIQQNPRYEESFVTQE
jgi:DedD protein